MVWGPYQPPGFPLPHRCFCFLSGMEISFPPWKCDWVSTSVGVGIDGVKSLGLLYEQNFGV